MMQTYLSRSLES